MIYVDILFLNTTYSLGQLQNFEERVGDIWVIGWLKGDVEWLIQFIIKRKAIFYMCC